ncbi:MAG: DNA repair protein RecO [Armatimonadota bacterium]|nr:DNA repair protein RecO [Armatimonadota bacterium]MDR7451266.1 DNA repair protein RecO [Armatimonadota bacterium]MDR7466831.1 DNA repair protein RecO [Armatimonadota bacterium]MDR7492696.1 DNA repair protein RecO [Armatimonadota bacterium]MDR7499625.1 DNA repair protein RecO [Armatimonadota bacterium]
MPVYRVEAIVLRRANLGEADRIVTLYTREHGKVAAVAKGARKPGSRFVGRLELFTHLRALLARGRTLDVVSQVEVVEPFAAIRGDLGRMGAASFIVEVADRATPEREPFPVLYRALRDALLAAAEGDAGLAAAWFAAQVLALSGYGPVTDRCVVCQRPITGGAAFSAALGGALCGPHRERDRGAVPASAVALATIGFLRETGAKALGRVVLDRAQRTEVEALLRRSVEERFEIRLRSPPVIERITRLR